LLFCLVLLVVALVIVLLKWDGFAEVFGFGRTRGRCVPVHSENSSKFPTATLTTTLPIQSTNTIPSLHLPNTLLNTQFALPSFLPPAESIHLAQSTLDTSFPPTRRRGSEWSVYAI